MSGNNKRAWECEMEPSSNSGRVSAKGILLPSEWDENGVVLGLTFFTHDEDEYRVKGKEIWPKLLEVLRQEVMVEGYFQWEEGKKTIR
jgi:hypothetical protein